jgi:hypothetical protein
MRRFAVVALLGALLAVVAPARADAADIAVAATVLTGSRTITVATLTPLADVVRTASVQGTLAVTVAEVGVDGVTPWSVTTRLCGPNGTNTASDCATHPDRLVLSTDNTKTISGANLTVSGRGVVQTLGGGTATATSGSETLAAARTIFTTTGQDPLLPYTGTYVSTSTVTLTPPSNATTGAYTGFLVVTLVS